MSCVHSKRCCLLSVNNSHLHFTSEQFILSIFIRTVLRGVEIGQVLRPVFLMHNKSKLITGLFPVAHVAYSDHNQLTFLTRIYNQNQRLMQWARVVRNKEQDYHLEIRHKKGSENVIADALSKLWFKVLFKI